MARGNNPNSKANLSKGQRFNSQTAKAAQTKSVVAHRQNSRLKKIASEALTDDVLTMIIMAMIKKAKNGNIAAFKALYDVMGEADRVEQKETEIRIAYLADLLPTEKPPADTQL